MHAPILRELMGGNLAKAFLSDDEIYNIVQLYKTKQSRIPSIYLRALVDDKGDSPTERQLLEVTEVMRRYAVGGNHRLAFQIDSEFGGKKAWSEDASARMDV